MKIAILSRNKKLYSTRRLVEVGKQRGHEMHVIDTLRCNMEITSSKPSVWYKGEELTFIQVQDTEKIFLKFERV